MVGIRFSRPYMDDPGDADETRREHVVPLTARAQAILRAVQRRGDLVFGELGRDAMIDLVKAAGRYTTHGFRAAFSTWAGERTGHPRDIVERVLAHATGSQVEQAYRRGAETERRLAVLEAWEKFVANDEPQGAVVVDFRRA